MCWKLIKLPIIPIQICCCAKCRRRYCNFNKKSNNDYDEIVINGNSYYYDNEDDGKIAVGIGGVFLLSSNNRIIMMTDESVAHDVTFGYLVSSWHEDYEDMGEARILTMDGNLVIYKFANKVKLDGVTYKKQDDMPLENRQLITYKLANNELKTIDTVYSNKRLLRAI